MEGGGLSRRDSNNKNNWRDAGHGLGTASQREFLLPHEKLLWFLSGMNVLEAREQMC